MLRNIYAILILMLVFVSTASGQTSGTILGHFKVEMCDTSTQTTFYKLGFYTLEGQVVFTNTLDAAGNPYTPFGSAVVGTCKGSNLDAALDSCTNYCVQRLCFPLFELPPLNNITATTDKNGGSLSLPGYPYSNINLYMDALASAIHADSFKLVASDFQYCIYIYGGDAQLGTTTFAFASVGSKKAQPVAGVRVWGQFGCDTETFLKVGIVACGSDEIKVSDTDLLGAVNNLSLKLDTISFKVDLNEKDTLNISFSNSDTVLVKTVDTVRVLPVPADVKKWNAKLERLDGTTKTFTRCREISVMIGTGATGDLAFSFADGTSEMLPLDLGISPKWNPSDENGIIADIIIDATGATKVYASTVGCGIFPFECEPSPLVVCGDFVPPVEPTDTSSCTGWTTASGTWFTGCCWASAGGTCGQDTTVQFCGALEDFSYSIPVSTPMNPNSGQTTIRVRFNPAYISAPLAQITVTQNGVILTQNNTISYYVFGNELVIKTTFVPGQNIFIATLDPDAPCPTENATISRNWSN